MKKERRSFDLNMMQEHAQKLGGKCHAHEYKNSTYRLLFECSEGHKWRATPLEIMGKKNSVGKWCPECEKLK
tara:strand:+ start:226373 stop:226588 length:216 start_codon:yes stop_codon:yes gene_type:complete